jgi:hypothetical protein
MSANLPNLTKSIAEVVSVDGWSKADGSTVTVYVDVSFRTAAVGGRKDDAVRFRLSLTRAELVAYLPETEGLKILPSSVERERFESVFHETRRSNENSSSDTTVTAQGRLSFSALIPSVSGRFSRAKGRRTDIDIIETFEKAGMVVNHRKASDGTHRWEMAALGSTAMKGSGWNATEAPRFQVERPRNDKIERTIVFQIRCLREDLRIEEAEVRNEIGEFIKITPKIRRNKFAAIEAFIKTELFNQGLLFGDLSNPYAEICLLETRIDL